jgi:prepilin-type N-terminal cleavage/methylation domain-containing protein
MVWSSQTMPKMKRGRMAVVGLAGRKRGFTLIEALVATVILGVGVVGLLSASVMGMRNSQRSEYAVTAMNVAREKMAEIQVKGPGVWTLGEKCNGREVRGGVVCEWTISIEDMTPGELYDVLVTVDWETATTSGKVKLETWLNDYKVAAMDRMTEKKNPLEKAGQKSLDRQ